MKAIVCTKQGDPVANNIRLDENWPDEPAPAPGWVTIKTLASAFNHMDLWVGRGVPGLKLEYPRVSGCDACGIVESVGEGVDNAWVGRKVIANAAVALPERQHPDDPPGSTLAPNFELIGEHTHGMHKHRFSVPAENLAAVHPDADPVQAAAFGLTMLTAWSMMVTKGALRPGQSVLVTGIGGGVATSAMKIAKHHACPVIVTSRHQWKLDRAKQLGADETILDEGQDWSKQVRSFTNKRGVDMAVDSAGKATHLNCIKSLARGGAYVTPGCTSGPDATTDLARIFWNQLRVLGSTMGGNNEFRELAALFSTGKLEPVIDKVFSPEECVEAYKRLEGAEQFGKIVVRW